MKQVRIFFFVCLSFGFFISTFGRQGQMGGVPQRKFEHRGKIDSRYDASTNKTTVILNPYVVPEIDTESAWIRQYYAIMCGFTYQGQKMTTSPETIEFHIIADTWKGFRFNDSQNRVLSIDIDGEQILLGTMTLVKSKHNVVPSSPDNLGATSSYREELSIILTYQGLLKITGGKKVSLLLAKERIKLDKEHLEALRDLASRIKVSV